MPTLLTSNKLKTHSADLDEQIRRVAYELYEQRGRTEGHDVDDWLQAEAEVTGSKSKIVAA